MSRWLLTIERTDSEWVVSVDTPSGVPRKYVGNSLTEVVNRAKEDLLTETLVSEYEART